MFKQYIFLLILSFFSIQGFAAGCPDGSEPVKSISADGTYFVFECNNNTQNSSSANQNYDITIVNKSSFPTKILQEWADSASSKMASRESDILVLLYDVGQVINPVKNLYGSFRLHQVLMSPKEINESKKLIEDWFINSGCSGGADYGLMNDIKVGLDKGLDWSSQWTLCTNKRLIVMALPEEMRSNPQGQDAVFIDIQGFLQHELYHAFQHDLANTGECRNRRDKKNSNSSWMIEGGARYFAERLLPFPKADFKDLILRPIYKNKMVLGDAEDVVGAAILLLMIERGLINESEIMDGSLFHDCARELKFDKNSDEMKFVLSNWNNEEYEFSLEILLDYDASRPSKDENKEDATSKEYQTVNYNTKLDEVCQGHIQANWPGYIDINKNEFNSKGFMFVVSGEDGRCENGIGPSSLAAFEDCTYAKEQNNIVGTCEPYAQGEEVIWGSSESNQKSTLETTEPENYVEEICQGHIQANWPGYIDINKNEFNSKGYMYIVSDKDGRCEHGIGPTSLAAYDDCTHWKEENNIIGTCELYAKGEEVVWGSSESNQKSTVDTTESEDYVEKLKQIRSLLDTGIINKEDFEKMKQKIIDTMN